MLCGIQGSLGSETVSLLSKVMKQLFTLVGDHHVPDCLDLIDLAASGKKAQGLAHVAFYSIRERRRLKTTVPLRILVLATYEEPKVITPCLEVLKLVESSSSR